MTTAATLITGALRLLRVVADGETPTASQSADGLEVLNQLMHGLKAEGADVKFADIGLGDDVPLPPEHIRPLRYVLAVDLAPEYSAKLTPEVSITAAGALDTLQAAYGRIPTLAVDPALLSRNYGNYDIDKG